MSSTYDAASRPVTTVQGSGTTTYTSDANGNLTGIIAASSRTTMTYDKENRMASYQKQSGPVAPPVWRTIYNGDGQRVAQGTALPLGRLVWDGTDYLQERR